MALAAKQHTTLFQKLQWLKCQNSSLEFSWPFAFENMWFCLSWSFFSFLLFQDTTSVPVLLQSHNMSLHLLSSPILSRLHSKFVSSKCLLGLPCKILIQSQVISHHFHYYHLDSSHHHLFQGLFVRVSNLSLCFYSYTSKSILHTLKSYYITSLLRIFY